MITIVGRKIVMEKGDTGAIRMIIRDSKGEEIPLSENEVITLRMRYKMESSASLSKSTTPITVNDNDIHKIYHLLQFTSEDTRNLPSGDYYYDVILESDNKRFTVVSKSVLSLKESVSLEDIENNVDENIMFFEDDIEMDYHSIMSATPLVGSMSVTHYTRVGTLSSGDIIRF